MTEREQKLLDENEELKIRLQEAEDALNAIRNGEVDAIVVSGTGGEKIYSLSTADTPYRIFLEQMEEGAVTMNNEGIILYCNQRFTEMIGLPYPQITGTHFSSFIETREHDKLSSLFEKGKSRRSSGEFRLLGASDLYEFCQLTVNPLPTESEAKIFIIVSNITELKSYQQHLSWLIKERTFELEEANRRLEEDMQSRQKAEAALQTTLERFYLMLSSMYTGVLLMTEQGRVEFLNQAFCDAYRLKKAPAEMTGISSRQLLAMISDEFEDPFLISRRISEIMRAEKPVSGEEFKLTDDRTGLCDFIPLSVNGIPCGRFWTHIDITEAKRNEENLRVSREQLAVVFNGVSETLMLLDLDGNILAANKIAQNRLGTETVEFVGKNIFDTIPVQFHEARKKQISELIQTKKRISFFDSLNETELEISFYPVLDKDGNVHQYISSALDITDRKKAEEVLQTTLQRFYLMFSGLQDGVLLVSGDDRVEFANQALCDIFGMKELPQDLLNMPANEIIERIKPFYSNPEAAISRILEIVRLGQKVVSEEVRMADGRTFLRSFIPVSFGGKVYGRLWSHIEITERKVMEEKVVQSNASLEATNKVLAATLTTRSEKELGDVCLAIAQEITQSEFGFIGNVNTDGLEDIAISNPGWDACTITSPQGHTITGNNFKIHGLYGKVITDGKSLITNNPPKHPDSIGLPEGHPPLHSFLGVPLVHEGKTIGIIAVGNRPGGYNEKQMEILNLLSPAVVEAFMRIRAEEKLIESEESFRTITETLPALISMSSLKDSRIIFTNSQYNETFGYDAMDINQKKGIDFYSDPSDRIKMLKILEEQGFVKEFQFRAKKRDGTIIWLLSSIQPIVYAGEPAIIAVSVDITWRVKAEEEIRRLAKFPSENPNPVLRFKPDGTLIYSNPASRPLIEGWKTEPGDVPPEEIRTIVVATFATKSNLDFEAESNGRNYILTTVPIPEQGYLNMYGRDITEQKIAEEQIRRSEATLRGIMDATQESIWMFNREGIVLQANNTALQRMRMNSEQVIGHGMVEVLGAEPGNKRMEMLRQVVTTGLSTEFEDEHTGMNFLHSFYPLVDSIGRVVAVVSFSRDITLRKQTERALAESEERYRNMFNSLIEGFCIVEMVFDTENKPVDYIFLEVNPVFEAQSGLTNAKGKRMRELAPDHEEFWFETYGKIALTGESIHFESEAKALNKWFEVQAVRLGGEGSRKVVIGFNDITIRKKAEGLLRAHLRSLKVMQKSSTLLANAVNEEDFLREICNLIVEECGHKMVWIGFKQDDPEKSVKPVVHAGFEEEYLKSLKISWGDTERGRGPTGIAIRTGQPAYCRNMLNDPTFEPWRKEALQRGYASSIVLPVIINAEVIGSLSIYSKDPDPWTGDEQNLLSKVADDLGYGITTIRLNQALKQSKQNLEVKVKERTELLKKTMDELEVERQRFLGVLNMIPAYVALITPDHQVPFSNQIFTEYFGEIGNKKCYEHLAGGTAICEDCKIESVLTQKQPCYFEWTDPKGRIYQISEFPFTDNDGASLVLEMGLDITEKKNVENLIMQKILEAEENERRRFASDLHDDLGPTLSAIKLQLSLLDSEKNFADKDTLLKSCDELLSESIGKMRTLSNNLMPSLLDLYGLESTLQSFIDRINKTGKIDINFHNNLEDYRFDKQTELHLYRIISELVNNTIKHSGASQIFLDITRTETEVRLLYSDNGRGYSAEQHYNESMGIGLQSIRQRVSLLKGTIDFKSIEGETVVLIRKPLQSQTG
jgi:PAS domain S-box-containing protein